LWSENQRLWRGGKFRENATAENVGGSGKKGGAKGERVEQAKRKDHGVKQKQKSERLGEKAKRRLRGGHFRRGYEKKTGIAALGISG